MESSGAPALSRGLEVLALLAESPALSLEAIARRLPHPKSTLHRLLEVLIAGGYVEKAPEKTYRARVALTRGFEAPLEDRLTRVLAALTGTLGATAEFYVPTPAGLVLGRQRFPRTGEVHVVARLGFLRPWTGELDAVARVGWAFSDPAPKVPAPRSHWAYGRGGERRKVSARDVAAAIRQCANDGAAVDAAYNTNGVRRCAAPVFGDGRFAGVVAAAASIQLPDPDPDAAHFFAAFRRLLSSPS